jgi:hypothetical protein
MTLVLRKSAVLNGRVRVRVRSRRHAFVADGSALQTSLMATSMLPRVAFE